jgi:hypothetical protein
MVHTDAQLLQSNWFKQGHHLSIYSRCKRLDDNVDIILTHEEKTLIDRIANIDGIQKYVEYSGWYDNCYLGQK